MSGSTAAEACTDESVKKLGALHHVVQLQSSRPTATRKLIPEELMLVVATQQRCIDDWYDDQLN
jgi:hypothetical protein